MSLAARPAFGSAARSAVPLEEEVLAPAEPAEPAESFSAQGGWLDDTLTSIERALGADGVRDSSRCITSITEVTGIDGKTILSQELFKFEFVEETSDGRIIGAY